MDGKNADEVLMNAHFSTLLIILVFIAIVAYYGRQVMYYANDRRAITPHET